MNKSLESVKKRLKKKSAQVQMFMNSELGSEIITALEEEFYHGELFDADPCKTAYNLGRRDVVVFFKQLKTWRNNDE